MKRKNIIIALSILVSIVIIKEGLFIISETEQAVILQLGNPIRIIVGNRSPEEIVEIETWISENAPGVALSNTPGLYFKIPFIQQARIYDDRILEYDDAPDEVVTKDKKHLEVDCFARWRIQNPLLFLRSVRTQSAAVSRLDDIIYSTLRQEMGKSNLIQIVRSTNDPIGLGEYVSLVSTVTYNDSIENIELDEAGEVIESIRLVTLPADQGRVNILERVTTACREITEEYGIYVVDVRIKRADLPLENKNAVYARMQAERNRISTRYRAEGLRMSEVIKANTDLRVDSIMAGANMNSLFIMGNADSTAAAIYANAYSDYSDFYTFTRSLETLELSLENTGSVILGTDGIFKYLISTPGSFND
ncbi:MAG: protease modulator HflC [FCB group bacterium]|nr:protease modulator HflC [FCB group bacterium]